VNNMLVISDLYHIKIGHIGHSPGFRHARPRDPLSTWRRSHYHFTLKLSTWPTSQDTMSVLSYLLVSKCQWCLL